jgi:hypothetical protein
MQTMDEWEQEESVAVQPLFSSLLKYITNTDTNTHLYEHTHVHHTSMSTSKRLIQFDLEIHEVGHQERLTVNRDGGSH